MATPSLPASPARPSLLTRRTGWLWLMLGAIAWSLHQAGIGQPRQALVNWDGLSQLGQFFQASLTPALDPEFLTIIGKATGVTLAYAVCGTTLSILVGFGGGILASGTWWRTLFPVGRPLGWLAPLLWMTCRSLLAVPRAIHELLWGLLLLHVLGLDPLVAVLAITIPFGAIVAKVFSEILDETPQQPLQALQAAGVPPLLAWLYGLLPQAFPNLLSYSFYRFECSLRSSAVLGVIGAGGLGYEILLSLQSLRYQQLWTSFYALILLNGAVDLWSALVRHRLGVTNRLALNLPQAGSNQNSNGARSPTQQRLRLSWLAIAIAIPLCFIALELDWRRLWSPHSRTLLADIATTAIPTWPSGATLATLMQLSGLTLAMSILAISLASSGGILFSFLGAQTMLLPGGLLCSSDQKKHWSIGAWAILLGSRGLLLLSRAIPAPIWALVFLYGLFPGILPGALALAVHNFGILGRLMAEANENLPTGPARALRTLGASASQVILYGILPQNLPGFLAYSLYRWEVCLRETVIVGLVGAGGLGRRLTEQLSSFDYAGLTVTLAAFLLLTLAVDLVSHQMRQALR
ncbi:Phosphate-import permease protein PhnE [Halomicronema hongdechloris C2206]|uniref:Phosphate-import permease protein PhnE n=2 Tax=Halomicronema hongdechloris TaxID=1209493 RepID=A0A1Z3HUU5_9CYAN|nr:Phosphate-import permease protein PhnE [Halomicronema hongdechloris C2206]